MDEIRKLAPPGINLESEGRAWLTGMILSLLYSFSFLLRLIDHRWYLFYTAEDGTRHLREGAIMPTFAQLLEGALNGFLVTAICLLLCSILHYLYYSSGKSHALYLVNRLPTRGYVAKTCLTLPVLACLGTLLFTALLFFAYFGLYHLLTPEECLLPNQWDAIWKEYSLC